MEPAHRGSERLGSAWAAPSRSAPRRQREPAGTCATKPSAPRSGPRLAGNAPRPAPSGDLQRLLASMQSSWGARRPLPGPPVQEHARPRPQGRPASLPRERKGLARRHSNAASGATRLVRCHTSLCLRLGARASVTKSVGRISLRGDQKATGGTTLQVPDVITRGSSPCSETWHGTPLGAPGSVRLRGFEATVRGRPVLLTK